VIRPIHRRDIWPIARDILNGMALLAGAYAFTLLGSSI
jgi:hypothetical protein